MQNPMRRCVRGLLSFAHFGTYLSISLGILPCNAYASLCHDCNVLLISIDTLGASHLGTYGSKRETSPEIDRFASNARIYQNAYAPSSWTLPSHAAMLTGFYPWTLGITGWEDKLPKEVPTLAHLLKTKGYETSAITGGFFLSKKYGFHRGFDRFAVIPLPKTFVDQSIEELKKKRQKPFFLFLHTYTIHEPFKPTQESLTALDPQYTGKVQEASMQRLLELASQETPDRAELNRISVLYDAAILDLDKELGRLFRFITQSGLDKNTVIILTSDHGEEMGEHGTWGFHATSLFNELIQVPLIVKIPGTASKKLKSRVILEDIAPSVLDWVGAPAVATNGQTMPDQDSEASENRSIHAMTSGTRSIVLEIESFRLKKKGDMSSYPPPEFTRGPRLPGQFMVFNGKNKLIFNPFESKFYLYDLGKDPFEKTNIFSSQPELESKLLSEMIIWK